MSEVGGREPRVFVEVGMGDMRVRGYGEQFPFCPGDWYIGADLPYVAAARSLPPEERLPIYVGREELERAARQHPYDEALEIGLKNDREIEAYANKRGVRFRPVYADGLQLPFANGAVDQVLFSNVLGDPSISSDLKCELLAEAQRVVRAGGAVVAKETYTPWIAEWFVESQGVPHEHYDDTRPEWVTFQGWYDLGRTAGVIIEIPGGAVSRTSSDNL